MGLLSRSSQENSWKPAVTGNTTAWSYWFNWRVLLCGMWIVISLSLALILIRKNEPFCCGTRPRQRQSGEEEEEEEEEKVLYDEEMWSPCLKGVHPAWLLGFRALAFALLLALLVVAVVVDGPTIYFYYTQWTSTSITVYFALGLALSARGCIRYHRAAGGERINSLEMDSENPIKSGGSMAANLHVVDHHRQVSGFSGYAFQILFQINAGAVVLTDFIFWFIIVPFLTAKHDRLSLLDVHMHTINAVLLLIDAALNRLRYPMFRIAYFFLWTAFFVIFQWVLHACISIWWPYPFLDLSSRYAPIWYLSVALMHPLCYGMFGLAIKLKHYLLARRFPESYQ